MPLFCSRKGTMIGTNFVVKNAKKFSEHNAKILPENSVPLWRNPQNTK